ncbi:roadblock/LC7 domain-containing protein [Geobacter sp. FeAm09]|uniref:roadblock/LC7 domain-containing protein n=1 Tax=Geobacter sp. FeAm09 TaxID=2597769 RepID=UPI0011EFB60F|nr:roadblock/LC7 domain-containing protein [Geobacter sp. FeAm09]QEM66704.1 roadblock/LC7 domain-containing protein [Geobacter sp. FeAm09]
MQDILQHINSVEGVIGSAVFGGRGEVLAHAFPSLIDAESLKKTAALSLECTYGLQIEQNLDILDLRYADGRILVKAFPGAMLCLLCAKNINLQVLFITLNLAVKKLESLLPKQGEPTAAVRQTDAPADQGGAAAALRLRISHLANKEASSSFDSFGMVAISQPTSKYIGDFYKAPFKKLRLVNEAAGTSGTFPVMVMNDMGQQYDGTIIVGPGIEKKLKVSDGDKIEVALG